MLNEVELLKVKGLIDSFQPGVTSFERDILTPGVIDRLKYIREICTEFKKICKDPDVANHIDGALRDIVDPKLFKLGVPEPQIGKQYLAMISQQLDADYISIIDSLLAKYTKNEIDLDFKKLASFYNESTLLFQTFVGLEQSLFQYSIRSFLNIKETATGKVILGPPVAITLSLMPFQTKLSELVNVSRTTIESIKLWASQIKDQKEKHIEIVVSLSQVKAAEEQVRAARYNLLFQVVVVVFTIALVVLGYWVNLFLEKRDLEKALERSEISLHTCNESANQLEAESTEFKSQLAEMQGKVKEHSQKAKIVTGSRGTKKQNGNSEIPNKKP